MANYAVIKDGIVTNVIVAESQEIAESVTGLTCIEYQLEPGAPGIGWSYDGTDFSAPVTEEPAEETPA
jgi:hypothetical protein